MNKPKMFLALFAFTVSICLEAHAADGEHHNCDVCEQR
jgi:hypothetical protein